MTSYWHLLHTYKGWHCCTTFDISTPNVFFFRHSTDTVFVTWLTDFEHSAWQQNSANGLCLATDTWFHGYIHEWSSAGSSKKSQVILFIIDFVVRHITDLMENACCRGSGNSHTLWTPKMLELTQSQGADPLAWCKSKVSNFRSRMGQILLLFVLFCIRKYFYKNLTGALATTSRDCTTASHS